MAQRTCSIEGCDAALSARGWCQKHYMRWWSTGRLELRPKNYCAVNGCERRVHCNGYCGMHYQRWLSHGDPLQTVKGTPGVGYERRIDLSAEERFWTYVDRRTGCWLWTGSLNGSGYGQFNSDGVRPRLAHRLSWGYINGLIPDGLFVLHRCDNPPCVRPDHLFLGTQADNMADMANKNRAAGAKRTHCKRGHPFDETNTGIAPGSGQRYCKACHKKQSAERWKRVSALNAAKKVHNRDYEQHDDEKNDHGFPFGL